MTEPAAIRTATTAPSTRYDFFVKIDFGIMQWTPLRTSTT